LLLGDAVTSPASPAPTALYGYTFFRLVLAFCFELMFALFQFAFVIDEKDPINCHKVNNFQLKLLGTLFKYLFSQKSWKAFKLGTVHKDDRTKPQKIDTLSACPKNVRTGSTPLTYLSVRTHINFEKS